MNLEDKISKLIPPDNRSDRSGFSNHHLIDKLNNDEKAMVENILIEKLYLEPCDMLIVSTLSYLKSLKSLSALKNSLVHCNIALQKIIISEAIYSIDQDDTMIYLVIDFAKNITDNRDLWFVFSYLKKFENDKINDFIRNYIDNDDFLVSHNAKKVLGLIE